ncbi:hypothetical protein B0H21DRAFT_586332 [Amylocystis lapponica]|nr:hypothetical protein B0H21DRAFT_586332 [Amylocystis lapponica]
MARAPRPGASITIDVLQRRVHSWHSPCCFSGRATSMRRAASTATWPCSDARILIFGAAMSAASSGTMRRSPAYPLRPKPLIPIHLRISPCWPRWTLCSSFPARRPIPGFAGTLVPPAVLAACPGTSSKAPAQSSSASVRLQALRLRAHCAGGSRPCGGPFLIRCCSRDSAGDKRAGVLLGASFARFCTCASRLASMCHALCGRFQLN